jgi:hypothetical protein
MQINSMSVYSSSAASRSNNMTSVSRTSSTSEASQPSAGGISTYDFTNMTQLELRDTVNSLISSGKLSADDPTATSLTSMAYIRQPSGQDVSNQPMDFMAKLRGGIQFDNSRGDAQSAERHTRALNFLESLQGTPSGVDVVA